MTPSDPLSWVLVTLRSCRTPFPARRAEYDGDFAHRLTVHATHLNYQHSPHVGLGVIGEA